MLPDISPHLYEIAYPPSPLVGLPEDPHVACWTSAFGAVPEEGRQVNHPRAFPRMPVDMLEDERVRANQGENRADVNETRLRELQAQMDVKEMEVLRLQNLLGDMTKMKEEAERQASHARKRETRLREHRTEEEGWDGGTWLTSEKNYESVWQEGWIKGHEDGQMQGHEDGRTRGYEAGYEAGRSAGWEKCWPVAHEKGRTQGYGEGHKKGRLASKKDYNAGWKECWPVAHEDGRTLGYEEGREEGYEEGRSAGWRKCWPIAYEEGQKQGFDGHAKDQSKDKLAAYVEEGRKKGKLKGFREVAREAGKRVLVRSNKSTEGTRSPMQVLIDIIG